MVYRIGAQVGFNIYDFAFDQVMVADLTDPAPGLFEITVNGGAVNPIAITVGPWLDPSRLVVSFIPPISPAPGDVILISQIAEFAPWRSAATGKTAKSWGPIQVIL